MVEVNNTYLRLYNNTLKLISNSKLSCESKEILKIVLDGDMFFLPFTVFSDHKLYSISKILLIEKIVNEKFVVRVFHQDIHGCYGMVFDFEKYMGLEKFSNHNSYKQISSKSLSLYVPYSYILEIYNKRLIENSDFFFWGDIIRDDDLNKVEVERIEWEKQQVYYCGICGKTEVDSDGEWCSLCGIDYDSWLTSGCSR